jgi:hypothetical protein
MSTSTSASASAAPGFTGAADEPIDRHLPSSIVTSLYQIRTLNIAALQHEELQYAVAAAQTLANNILTADQPVMIDPDAMEGDLRTELPTVIVERHAARRDMVAFQQQSATLSNQLTQVLTLGANNRANDNDNSAKSFPDVFMFDRTKPSQIQPWILKLQIKLTFQSNRFSTEQSQLRYAFSRLSDGAFDQVRSFLDEDTGVISMDSLNTHLASLRAVYDDPDQARTARRELKTLKMGSKTCPLYLAQFRSLVEDLNLNEDTQMHELKDGLSSVLRDALILKGRIDTLGELVEVLQDLNAGFRARDDEKKDEALTAAPPRTHRTPRTTSATTATPATLAPALRGHPTDSNSGSYGDAPMNLSTAERERRRTERMARGECTYCGTLGHFRAECPRRKEKAARDLRIAQRGFSGTAAPGSANVQSHAASLATV